jgi:putative ABC transport system permease protein
MSRLESDNPQTNRGLSARVVEMRRLGQDRSAPTAMILIGAVGFVLLLACANVANLLLSRACVRDRELSVRAALGAGRGRLVQQLLTESVMLSTAGAGLGLVLAYWVLHALRASLPELLLTTAPNVLDLGIDGWTLGFTAGIALLSALLFGVAPAVRTARRDFGAPLRSGATSGAGPTHQRFRAALMVSEVAMALVLLVIAGLLIRTFDRLRQVDPGFDPDHVLTMTVSLPNYRYAGTPVQRQYFDRAGENISRLPIVQSAAWVNVLPFSTYNHVTRFVVEGTAPEPGREPAADHRVITSDYFRVLKIPLLGGRAFDSRDRDGGQPVVIINRTLARREFSDGDPVGRRLQLGRRGSTMPWLTVVGVVGDVLHSEMTARPAPTVYVPFAQAPGPMMMLAARTAPDPDSARDSVVAAIAAVDPIQPVYDVKPLRDLLDAALIPSAAAMSMMAVFGALSLLLATVGIYAIISYTVSQQTREMGVRLALGASPGDVMQLVLRRGLSLILVGAALGAAGALGVAWLIRGILYGVPPSDALTYAVVGTLFAAVGAAACYVPARRATRLNPVDVLRSE